MNLEVVSTKVNPLLARREIAFEIEQPSTPNRRDVTQELSGLMKVKTDQVCIIRLQTYSGSQKTRGRAHIYDTAAQARLVEPKYMMQRNNKVKEEKKKEEE